MNNRLTQLPSAIGQLHNLTELYLSDNDLTQLPPEIRQLLNLFRLDLDSNQLSQLPPQIGQMINLTILDLMNNRLTQLPPEIGQMTNLTQLSLNDNQLSLLPPQIGQMDNLTLLDLNDNPIESPPIEIAKQGMVAIKAYFEQLESEKQDILCEAKLLIVGEPGAGKTSLARKLLNPQAELPQAEDTTRGIDIKTWEFPLGNNVLHIKTAASLSNSGPPHSETNNNSAKINLKETFQANLWDFGGQEIYQATHRFFLTKRSLYVLVADNRKEDTDFYYWLNIAELLGGDSPVLIVKNEKDDRPRPINEGQLRERFTNLKGVLTTNLADGRGLAELIDTIQFHLIHLPHVGDVLPKSWFKVRYALEADNRNYIDWRDYLILCETHGFKRLVDKLNLSTYLHELGVCLHYQDDPILKRTVFLKPDWCTDAVYKVLDTRQIVLNQGHFTQAELDEIWDDAEYIFMRDELLQMMLKFKLCYKIPHTSGDYIAPQLLGPEPPPYHWNNDGNLHLRYRYRRFMPKGIVATFTVMLHRYVWQQTHVWRGGLILYKDDTLAEIVEDYEGRQIMIRIRGEHPRDLLRTVIDNFEEIHEGYHNLQYDTLVPCNCEECSTLSTPHFYQYKNLRRRQTKGKHTVECEISYEDVNVDALLNATLGSSTEQPDDGLSADLKKQLTTVLTDCPQFAMERQFQAMFVDRRIIPWRNRLPQADSIQGRVEVVISELYNQYNRDGKNALVLFLQVLQDGFDSMDALNEQLGYLVEELQLAQQTQD